jgi:phage terminase large subunit-like protein
LPTASPPTKPKSRRTSSKRSTSSRRGERAERDLFAGFCRGTLTNDKGAPLEIESFQRKMLADYFAGIRSTLIVVPKKNGKTTVLGALALFHLLSTPDAECVIAAASREQAGIMLRQIHGFIRRSDQLRERLRVTQRVITYNRLGGQIRILASDVDTMDGVIPTLALIDELHRHKRTDVYGVLRDGLGPRGGQLVTISTAGDDENSPLGQLRAAAYALPRMKRAGAYRHVRTDDFALHEWALEPDQDRDDLKLVKTANPASWTRKRFASGPPRS